MNVQESVKRDFLTLTRALMQSALFEVFDVTFRFAFVAHLQAVTDALHYFGRIVLDREKTHDGTSSSDHPLLLAVSCQDHSPHRRSN